MEQVRFESMSDRDVVERLVELLQEERRLTVAVLARLGEVVADGRVHLSGVVLLAPHLTDDNAAELVAAASGKSKTEIEILLARRAPRPDVPERLERIGEQAVLLAPEPPGQVAPEPPGQVAPEPPGQVAPEPPRVAAKVAPLSAERFGGGGWRAMGRGARSSRRTAGGARRPGSSSSITWCRSSRVARRVAG